MSLTLRELSDRVAVEDALTSYVYGLDQRAWDLWAELFTPDALLDYTGANMGTYSPAEFRAKVSAGDAMRISGQHLHSNCLVVVTANDALARAEYTMVTMTRAAQPGRAQQVRAGGTCEYRLRRLEDQWRISSRTTTVKWLDRNEVEWVE